MAKLEISGRAARQGERKHMMLRVLLVSTLVAFALLVLLYFVFWPWPEPDQAPPRPQPAQQSSPPIIPPGEGGDGQAGQPAR